ncbi:MAG: toll/interleukin-1 receptor domain-containing protein, partial [Pseudomonadota bacterium]
MQEQNAAQGKHTVFVSYAHESVAFGAQVEQLCVWLRSQGISLECDFDHADRPPPKGWTTWMQHGIEDASVVLVVASPKYKARFEKRAAPDSGRGVAWEGAIITQDLYDAALCNHKFYPIRPDGGSPDDVPKALRPWDNKHLFPSGQEGILKLIRLCFSGRPPTTAS